MERTFRELDEVLVLPLELELSLQGSVAHDQVAVRWGLLSQAVVKKVARVAYRHVFFCRRCEWMSM